MFAIQRQFFKSSTRSTRALSSLSIEIVGSPLKVLKFDAKPATARPPKSDEVTVKVNYTPVLVEDLRAIRGISMNHGNAGVAGTTAVGKVAGSNDVVFIADSPSWADTITAPKNNVHKLEGVTAEDGAALPALLSAWAILKSTNANAGDVVVQSEGESSVGQAISQLGKLSNVNVVSVTSSELADANFAKNIKAKGNVKACVTGSSGKHTHAMMKVLPDNGRLVAYHGIYQNLETVTGVDVPIGRAIFNGTQIHGFDFHSWYRSSPEQFQVALKEVTKLLREKKVTLKATVHDGADFGKAVSEVESTGRLSAFKF